MVTVALTSCSRWIVGALDSAWRAVYSYLLYTDPSKLEVFYTLWGRNEEWFEPLAEPETGKPNNNSLVVPTSCFRRIFGALDSAWRTLYSYLLFIDPRKLDVFYALWDKNAEFLEQEPDTVKTINNHDSLLERYLRNAQTSKGLKVLTV